MKKNLVKILIPVFAVLLSCNNKPEKSESINLKFNYQPEAHTIIMWIWI